MEIRRQFITTLTLTASLLLCGCQAKIPSRDHIPALQTKLYQLQQAVKHRNRAEIDSLLSIEMLQYDQNSDSLLRLVYNSANGFEFAQFGDYDMAYTHDRARIDCYLMDSSSRKDRKISFTLTLNDTLWLFKRFELITDTSLSDSGLQSSSP